MVMNQVALRHQLLFHHDGNPDFRAQPGLAPLKYRGRHADNRVGVLIDFERLAHDIRIRAEVRLPQPVTDHGHGRAARFVVLLGKKTAPQDRPDAQQIEIVRGRHHSPHALRFALSRQTHGSDIGGGDADETLLPVAHGLKIRIGKRERIVRAAPEAQGHHLVRAGEAGNRIEQCGVDPAENRGVRADAQREREDGDCGVAGRLRDHAQAVTNVLPERSHPRTSRDTLE